MDRNFAVKIAAHKNIVSGFMDVRGLRSFFSACKTPVGLGRVLLVGDPANFQTPTSTGIVSDRLMYWNRAVLAGGYSTATGLIPFAGPVKRKTYPRPLRPEASLLKLRRFSHNRRKVSESKPKHLRKHPLRFLRWTIWLRTVSTLDPVAVIGIGLDSDLLRICKSLKIPTIEIQHGIWTTGAEETLFQYWPESEEGKRQIPDLICAWDNTYVDHAIEKGFCAINCGYQITGITHNYSNSKSVDVVVTASWGRSNTVDPYGMVDDQLHRAIELITVAGFRVAIRTHPVAESYATHEKLRRSLSELYPSVTVLFASEESIQVSLGRGSLHLTYSSAACVDAALLGTPSLCLSVSENYIFPLGMIEAGWITFGTPADALEILTKPAPSTHYRLRDEHESFERILLKLRKRPELLQ